MRFAVLAILFLIKLCLRRNIHAPDFQSYLNIDFIRDFSGGHQCKRTMFTFIKVILFYSWLISSDTRSNAAYFAHGENENYI